MGRWVGRYPCVCVCAEREWDGYIHVRWAWHDCVMVWYCKVCVNCFLIVCRVHGGYLGG